MYVWIFEFYFEVKVSQTESAGLTKTNKFTLESNTGFSQDRFPSRYSRERCVLEKGTAGQESAVDHGGPTRKALKHLLVPVCGIQLLENVRLSKSHLFRSHHPPICSFPVRNYLSKRHKKKIKTKTNPSRGSFLEVGLKMQTELRELGSICSQSPQKSVSSSWPPGSWIPPVVNT